MSKLKIVVKDYRAIHSADVEFTPGITLISAQNCSGKSTLIKAVKTTLDGEFGDEANFRHGTDTYAVALRYNDFKVIARRVGKETYLKVGDEPERSKLGRNSLNKLAPQFPIRRVDYQDSSFYPNISSQNKVPVFGDISVFDLFASMFSSISKLSTRLDLLKKEGINVAKNASSLESIVADTKAQKIQAQQDLDTFNTQHPDVEARQERLNQIEAFRFSLEQQNIQLSGVKASFDYDRTSQAATLLGQAADAMRAYTFVQAIEPQIRSIHEAEEQLKQLPELPPIVDGELIRSVVSLRNDQEELKCCENDLVQVNTQIEAVKEQLKKLGCPHLINGECPYV